MLSRVYEGSVLRLVQSLQRPRRFGPKGQSIHICIISTTTERKEEKGLQRMKEQGEDPAGLSGLDTAGERFRQSDSPARDVAAIADGDHELGLYVLEELGCCLLAELVYIVASVASDPHRHQGYHPLERRRQSPRGRSRRGKCVLVHIKSAKTCTLVLASTPASPGSTAVSVLIVVVIMILEVGDHGLQTKAPLAYFGVGEVVMMQCFSRLFHLLPDVIFDLVLGLPLGRTSC
ncbi:hypothetical protein QBC37DRAFT_399700 [Rhypophila decipiens]|uniref:Uncharacterized protein n=1 Tax=Rhypophila decipiens TaxID=261697 RepID=A0AAN6Y913_9PEZI|nr:hypothetical protein QBC37DRAFT_399700 [Rhypophila decipiens]